jgi:ankyrin repeat protein
VSARDLDEVLKSTADVLFPEIIEGARIEITSRGCDGDTPLHVMTWREDVEGVRVLLTAGADPNAIGDMSETPLHVACRVASPAIVEALLAAGARTDICGEFDVTPADLAQEDPVLLQLFANKR